MYESNMFFNALSQIKDRLHALLCYQFFITPLPIPLEREYRGFAERGCEFVATHRTKLIRIAHPRPHVIHYFSQPDPNAKKVIITHGWMSRASYMVRFIRALHKAGYEVYAIDFPAHGDAKGLQLTWQDAVGIIRETVNRLGKVHAVVGHSFGGSMILNALNLSSQSPEWQIDTPPTYAVLMASPTRMYIPVLSIARYLRLNRRSLLQFRDHISCNESTHFNRLNFRNLRANCTTDILCIHGKEDATVSAEDSLVFSRHYPKAALSLFPDMDHVSILFDKRAENRVLEFLSEGPGE